MPRTILIIDDSEIVLGIAKTVLEEAGYEVTTHRRATGSVGLILQTKPDLVLLDVNMPTLKGDMVARMSMATNKTKATIVVLHSTLPEEELSRLMRESGAHGYIRKTDNSRHFLRQVRRFFDDSAPQSIVASSARDAEAFPTSRAVQKSASVLLVDSDMSALSALRQQVQALGHSPSFALSLGQVAAKLKAEKPSLLFVGHEFGHWEELFRLVSPAFRRKNMILLCDDSRSAPTAFTGRILLRPVTASALSDVFAQLLENRDVQVHT